MTLMTASKGLPPVAGRALLVLDDLSTPPNMLLREKEDMRLRFGGLGPSRNFEMDESEFVLGSGSNVEYEEYGREVVSSDSDESRPSPEPKPDLLWTEGVKGGVLLVLLVDESVESRRRDQARGFAVAERNCCARIPAWLKSAGTGCSCVAGQRKGCTIG